MYFFHESKVNKLLSPNNEIEFGKFPQICTEWDYHKIKANRAARIKTFAKSSIDEFFFCRHIDV